MRIKWLHISDIHFNYKNFDSEILRKDFISRISDLSKREHFSHLILTGDMLFKYGEPSERTTRFLNDLLAAMCLSKERVFVVPGNHDHDRTIAEAYMRKLIKREEKARKKQQDTKTFIVSAIDGLGDNSFSPFLESFKKYNDLIGNCFNKPYYSNFSNPHRLETRGNLNIIHLNTAWLDYKSDDSGDLYIGSFQLQKLLEENEQMLQKTSCLNIAIGHHPLEDFSEIERKRALDLLSRYNFGIYFCGHRHKPSVKYYPEKDVIQITCPGGFVDDYSEGGYVWGIIDTDCDFYRAEFFNWNDGSWSIESKLDGTDEYGIYYFRSKRFCHNSDIVAIDAKLYDGLIPKQQIDASIGDSNYSIVPCNITLDEDWSQQEPSIQVIANRIKDLVEQGKAVHLYPLAPIPTLIRLGFELQNNIKIFVHQYDRDNERWVYASGKDSVTVSLTERCVGSSALVVKVSTSATIPDKTVKDSLDFNCFDTIEVVTEPTKFGFPLYQNGVRAVTDTVIDYLNNNGSKYESIHIFAAVPAGLSVELGRKMLKSIFSNVYLYNYSGGKYEPAFILNPKTIETQEKINLNNIVPFSQTGEIVKVPIIGDIACGSISEAIDGSIEYFPVAESLLSTGDYYILRAKGDSMIGANIEEGDLILVRHQITANDGDIVVARVESETTLKRMYHDSVRKLLVLHSENELYEDQEYSELDIQGVAVMVIKSLHH